jgi:hypothetical protein
VRQYKTHICFVGSYKPGDPQPEGYLDRQEWARVQLKAGLRQRRCPRCSLNSLNSSRAHVGVKSEVAGRGCE